MKSFDIRDFVLIRTNELIESSVFQYEPIQRGGNDICMYIRIYSIIHTYTNN